MTEQSSPLTTPEMPKTPENAKTPKTKRMTPQEQLDKLKARVLTLESRASSILARESAKARKLDTHRKAILGGAIMALRAQKKPISWDAICAYIIAESTARQREAVADLL